MDKNRNTNWNKDNDDNTYNKLNSKNKHVLKMADQIQALVLSKTKSTTPSVTPTPRKWVHNFQIFGIFVFYSHGQMHNRGIRLICTCSIYTYIYIYIFSINGSTL